MQQRPSLERRFGEGPNLTAHRGLDCTGGGGAVGGSAEDDVSQRTQRRTAEQIVDPPAPVFPERISMSLQTLSWFIEAAETSSQDQILQRTVEQNIDDKMNKAISQVMEKTLEAREVGKTTLQEQISESAQDLVPEKCRGRHNCPSGANFWTESGYRSAQDLVPGKCRGRRKYPSRANFCVCKYSQLHMSVKHDHEHQRKDATTPTTPTTTQRRLGALPQSHPGLCGTLVGPGKDTHGTPVPEREGRGWPDTKFHKTTTNKRQHDKEKH